jgi:hypothetical protein
MSESPGVSRSSDNGTNRGNFLTNLTSGMNHRGLSGELFGSKYFDSGSNAV